MHLNRPILLIVFISVASTVGAQTSKTPVPPTLSCGSLAQSSTVIAVSDSPGFPDQRHDSSAAPFPLSEGITKLPSLSSDYTNNGGGGAQLMNVFAQCQHGPSAVTNASLQVSISGTLWARAGHCCSGRNPGGVVNFGPAWTSSFVLPGTMGTNTWNIKLSYFISKSGVNAKCTWDLDARKQFPLSLSSNSTIQALSISPGTHIMSVVCRADDFNVDARPGNVGWENQSSATDSIKMSWTVVKSVN